MHPIRRAQASIINKVYIPKSARNKIQLVIEDGYLKIKDNV